MFNLAWDRLSVCYGRVGKSLGKQKREHKSKVDLMSQVDMISELSPFYYTENYNAKKETIPY